MEEGGELGALCHRAAELIRNADISNLLPSSVL